MIKPPKATLIRGLTIAVALGLAGVLLPVRAQTAYSPTLDIALSNANSSANSNVRITTLAPAGASGLSVWSIFLPDAWDVAAGSQVSDEQITAQGTMTVDENCDGSIQSYGPFNFIDSAGSNGAHAYWSGQITTGWTILVTVDREPPGPFDLSADMVNFIPFRTLCGPQDFTLTILGRSLPGNQVVLTNPSAAGTHTWEGHFTSQLGESSNPIFESVIIGLDGDTDGIVNASDNCPTVANPDQLNVNPPDGVGDACDPDDYDLDQFSDRIEYFAGTDRAADCAATPTHNAWPPDFNNDQNVTGADISLVAASIGTPVPPAPARRDIAPDPPDGSITGLDLSAVAGRIGRNCAATDQDGDGVSDAGDNCPTIANPDQRNISPPDGVGDACDPDDFDLDAFSDRIEYFAGTNPGARCAVTTADNAWPPDFNNDRNVTGADLSLIAADIGNPVPPALARKDIAPDPPDRSITGSDLSAVAGRIGLTCTP